MMQEWSRLIWVWLICGMTTVVAAQTSSQPTAAASAQTLPPPVEVTASDHPNDVGDKIDVSWQLSPGDDPQVADRQVWEYRLERSSDVDSGWVELGVVPYGTSTFEDGRCKRGRSYQYRVTALGKDGVVSSSVQTTAPTMARMQLFDASRTWFLLMTIIICGAVIAFVLLARSGRPLKIRKIAGLEVVDEAVGRATEMGRTCLFVPGIQDLNDIQTVAGITVLSRVAETAAEYASTVEVPTSRSLVMTSAQETVEAAYLAAGRPDAYDPHKIYYVTDEQFGYVAYLSGMMVRDKPAACFYMGSFFAESLILAETGNHIGAIQVAGTAQPSQLPFFVAACDYTLIGEEFFAASAYLSGEPDQLGSLKGQDVGKLVVAALLIIGCVLNTLHELLPEQQSIAVAFDYLMKVILSSGGAA